MNVIESHRQLRLFSGFSSVGGVLRLDWIRTGRLQILSDSVMGTEEYLLSAARLVDLDCGTQICSLLCSHS